MDSGFSLIIANFRSAKLDEVEKRLERLGVERINVSIVRGFGEYRNYFAPNWLESEARMEIFTKKHEVEKIVSAIIETARSGHSGLPGDGVVAVLPIDKLFLIRTACEATPEMFWPKREPMRALQKIRDEHRSISAVLHALKQLARDMQDARPKPSFDVFRAIVRYIGEFSEQLHHPKEDQLLFPALLARVPETRALVDSLKGEHREGRRLIRKLERALVVFEDGWPAGAEELMRTIDAYADFHWRHMRKEEQEILPLAEKYLSARDWEAIDEAFDVNQDPISGVREKDFQDLFSRIVRLAPASAAA